MRRLARSVIVALSLLGQSLLGQAAQAQQSGPNLDVNRSTVVSPVLTIDSERLFLESDFGLRVAAEVEAKGAVLAAENRKIEADLEFEERRLTELRATMDAEEFRVLANAFDEKVQRTRQVQDAKGRALNLSLDNERKAFLGAAAPVLERLMQEADAVVIFELELRSVFVSSSLIEITDAAIARINETLGSGAE